RVLATGKPILIDLLDNRAGTFVVSRIPLRDDAGEVIGVLGIVLFDHPETTLQPLITKFARLEQDLKEAQRQLATQRRSKYTFASFVGTSPAAVEVKRQARRAAMSTSPVLLLGETGTGKELLAHAIHAASPRAGKPFVGVNMAAVPESLLEAESFGVAPGAYTGADRRGRDGKFKLADGGTLFLDELGDMPMALQAKLLRGLQEREVEPLGSNAVSRVDVRVIAATSVDLGQLVEERRFRADLYYRLNVLPIRLPPLRERVEDLEPLCEHLLEQLALEHEMLPKEIDRDALEALAAMPWPGNVRELRNALERACSLWDGMRLTLEAFREVVPEIGAVAGRQDAAVSRPGPGADVEDAARGGRVIGASAPASTDPTAVGESSDGAATLPERIAALERAAIRDALRATGGNRVQAARRLGIARATLYQKLAESPELAGTPADRVA